MRSPGSIRLATLGHSNRPLEGFVSLLRSGGVERAFDIRRHPGSRKWPHFSRESLAESLPRDGIEYRWMPELGGRRAPRLDSPHVAWRSDSFRGYADYLDTDEGATALEALLTLAAEKSSAIFCAEAVPWRCHRSLVADALMARGVEVVDLISPSSSREHTLPEFARVEDGRVVYDVMREPEMFG
jgi:uncharacterized protein (DUF488 family)